MAARGSPWRRRPTGCSVCCRRGITAGCVGIYFIETGVGSLVNTMANGQAAEVGTIGNEGMVGLPLLLGDDRAPTSVYVQVPGSGLRMKASLFEKELARSATMRTVMLHYAHAFFNQVNNSQKVPNR